MSPPSASGQDTHRNRLAGETSPYLLQHADNPVDWYLWGADALERARVEDRPILLSIGYSACHWCHVMAHESFEDADTAALMNELFVNIKVDREERPDIDRIYQLALQMLTRRSGGWPLTMALTPGSLVPFFGGTYFPREPRYGMPSFRDVLGRVAAFYHERREDLDAQNAEVLQAFATLDDHPPRDDEPSAMVLDMARHQLEHTFDDRNGGFGGAPKFPHPPHLVRLLRHAAAARRRGEADDKAEHMATFSLARMAGSGLYDQVAGGFYRYSVDAQWMIPHFEKMLYDTAQLLPLYADAWSLTGDARFERTAIGTGDWVMRDMQSAAGGYYASLDADSEGEEGRFYLWTPDEASALLDEDEYAALAARFGLDRPPNFEGRWHLHAFEDTADVARALGRGEAATEALIDRARAKLRQAREARVHPGRDEKVLTAWNALMIRGMAIAARALGRDDFLGSATRALDFIRTCLWRDGRLLVTWKDGEARLGAYLDEYAFLLDALLELLQARWRDEDLVLAIEVADALIEHFEDRDRGGFFFTAHDHETLIHRPRPFGDDALPSGNGVAARALQRLGLVVGDPRYTDAAERTLRAAWPQIAQIPYAHDTLLDALEEYLDPPQIVVLRGDRATVADWLHICREGYRPERLVFAVPPEATRLPGLLGERRAPAQGALAWVCSGTACAAPAESAEALRTALAAGGGR